MKMVVAPTGTLAVNVAVKENRRIEMNKDYFMRDLKNDKPSKDNSRLVEASIFFGFVITLVVAYFIAATW